MNRTVVLISSLMYLACPTIAMAQSQAIEQEHLAQVLNQLSHIEASLQHASQSAATDTRQRYFFDYPRIRADIQIIRDGIQRYQTPSRAQPLNVDELSGQYRLERNGQ